MDGDLDTKRKKLVEQDEKENIASRVVSQFFSNAGTAGGSRREQDGMVGTEEMVLVVDLDNEQVEDAEGWDEEPDEVTQEDGYLSPAPSLKRLSTPDLSSPPRPSDPSRVFRHDSSAQDFAVDILSSPETRKPAGPRRSKSLSDTEIEPFGCILVPDTPRKSRPAHPAGPDLFEDSVSDIIEIDDFGTPPCSFGGSTQSSSSLESPASQGVTGTATCDEVLDLEDEIEFIGVRQASQDAVARGWWSKWACGEVVTKPSRGTAKDQNGHRVRLFDLAGLGTLYLFAGIYAFATSRNDGYSRRPPWSVKVLAEGTNKSSN